MRKFTLLALLCLCFVGVASAQTTNGHEYVDLGLPSGTLWATCNVGATSPEGYGDYFAWGETEPKSTYDWSTYKWAQYNSSTSGWEMTKYTNTETETLEAADDAATVNWGGDWRIPTVTEYQELVDNCTWTWTTLNGVNGYSIVGNNGNSIFFPAAGSNFGSGVSDVGSFGGYSSSSLFLDGGVDAHVLSIGSSNYELGFSWRCYGRSIRPVYAGNSATNQDTHSLESLWIKREADVDYVSAGNVNRSMTYYDGKLYVPDISGYLYVVDAANGTLLSSLNYSDVSYFHGHNIRITSDGQMLAGNTGTGATDVNLYTVDKATGAGTFWGTVPIGGRSDYFYTYGSWQDGGYALALGNAGNTLTKIPFQNGTFGTAEQITHADLPTGTSAKAIPALDGKSFYATAQFAPPTQHDITTGQKIDEFPTGTVSGYYPGVGLFTLHGNTYMLLPVDRYGQFELWDVTNGLSNATKLYTTDPALGTTVNGTLTVEFATYVSGNEAYIYVLAPNNGVAAYKFTLTSVEQEPQVPGLIIEAIGSNTQDGVVYTTPNVETLITLHATGENLTEDVTLHLTATGPNTATLNPTTISVSAADLQAEGGCDISFAFAADSGFYNVKITAESADFPITAQEGDTLCPPSFETSIFVMVDEVSPELTIEATGQNVDKNVVYAQVGVETPITLHATAANLTEDVKLYLELFSLAGTGTLSVDSLMLTAADLQAAGGCKFSMAFTADTAASYHIKIVANSADFPITTEVLEGDTVVQPSFETSIVVLATIEAPELPTKYTVSVTADETMGSVTGAGTYDKDATATLTAVANSGYQFTQWSDGVTDNPRTIVVTSDITLTASFEASQPTLAEQVVYYLNGGTVDVPVDNQALWELFMPAYNAYYGEMRGNQLLEGNGVAAFMTQGQAMMTDIASGWKWLGDYITRVSTAQWIEISSELLWRYSVQAFFMANLHGSWPYPADFTLYGQPAMWQPYYVMAFPPTKDGFVFGGWYDNESFTGSPVTDVANITTGKMYAKWIDPAVEEVPNTHTLNYVVDGEVVSTEYLQTGASIQPQAEPTKEGHTFSGWSTIPATMPAYDVTITGSFTVNNYTLSYVVDGVTISTETVLYGTSLVAKADSIKEGYTFSGWSEQPATMPAYDVTITGSFTINSYTLTYMLDGAVYSTETVEYGTPLVLKEEPTKEGFVFSGWSELPATMPAQDVTVWGVFPTARYQVTYMMDGVVLATDSVWAGLPITISVEPTKEGYTFSGWQDVPTVMPEYDVTLTGSFVINTYTLSYVVDGETIGSESVTYNAPVVAQPEPTKEGYTFSGWSNLPEVMPANDVTVVGSFTANSYTVTYTVDGEVVSTEVVEYGAVLTAPQTPTKEGYKFSGWSEHPETMPAQDLVIVATFTLESYTLTYLIDGYVYSTQEVDYNTPIETGNVPFREGYTFSGWNEVPATMPAYDLTISGTFTVNSYPLSYVLDGDTISTEQVTYGTPLTLKAAPSKTGHIFSGWTPIPETMPAYKLVVVGRLVPITVTEVALDVTQLELFVGKQYHLIVTVSPTDALDKTITWETDNSAVATVENGLVTALTRGTAAITAVSLTTGYQAVCAVTVRDDTALEDVSADATQTARKVLENGVLYIIHPNGEKYTIDGRKVY